MKPEFESLIESVVRGSGMCGKLDLPCLKSECSANWGRCDYRGPLSVWREFRARERIKRGLKLD